MIREFISINFAPLTGLVFFILFLCFDKKPDRKIRSLFLLLWGLEVAEFVAYNLELWTASFAEPTAWRILFSAIGYGIRPFLLLGLLFIEAREVLTKKQFLFISVPAVVNVVMAFSAFFTDIVYSYNDRNEFERGPLGYFTHAVVITYLICIIVFSFRKVEKEQRVERMIVWVISLAIFLAIAFEAVFSLRNLGRIEILLSTMAYYLYFMSHVYKESINQYMEKKIHSQKEHIREMNIIGVLANEYVTVCYVDTQKNMVIPYRMAPVIEEKYGEYLRSGATFEQVFRNYVLQDIYEKDREFFLNLANLDDMIAYLKENGNLAKNYRVLRNDTILYCEMRVELVRVEGGVEDLVFGFSNNDMRVRKEMVSQSAIQKEIEKIKEAQESLAGIASLAKQLENVIDEKLSSIK